MALTIYQIWQKGLIRTKNGSKATYTETRRRIFKALKPKKVDGKYRIEESDVMKLL